MLYADRKTADGNLVLHLYGAIDDRADLMSVIGSVPMAVIFNMRGVTKINSTGTGAWIKFVECLKANGVKMSYVECSSPFAGCLSFLVSDRAGGKIESIFAPFRCPKCKVDEQVLIKTPDISTVKSQITNQLCKACKGPLEFDEIFLEYFSFLKG